MPKLSVAIVGYGTIGKRVTDAVNLQSDMRVVGMVKTKPDIFTRAAVERGIPLYSATKEGLRAFSEAKIDVQGSIEDLLSRGGVDIVVHCAAEGSGEKNKPLYQRAGLKTIFQGGEEAEIAEASFVAEANYDEAVGRQFVRVVSCNTTGLARTVSRVLRLSGIKKLRATIVRRGADPSESKKGPINALLPNPSRLPSHHGRDLQTVLHGLPVVTAAVVTPTTLMHMHVVNAELEEKLTADKILDSFSDSKRIRLVSSSEGLDSTASVMELARDMGRKRGDMPEVVVWKESVSVVDGELYYLQAVHQESIVVPENVDAIRAACELEREGARSITATNKSLGLE